MYSILGVEVYTTKGAVYDQISSGLPATKPVGHQTGRIETPKGGGQAAAELAPPRKAATEAWQSRQAKRLQSDHGHSQPSIHDTFPHTVEDGESFLHGRARSVYCYALWW